MCLPVPRGCYHGLYIEMKDGTNKTTQNQKRWLEALSKHGYYTAVCYGFEKAKDTIVNYLEVRT